MGNPTGFIQIHRRKPPYRPVDERRQDFREVERALDESELRAQASRCMDCGVPFCHQGCPLGNVIPEWNDFVYHGRYREACDALHATNNFPEFTGLLCPAPCEEACVLNLRGEPVTIRHVESQIVDRAFEEGWIVPKPPAERTGRHVAIVGSGPAGLAAAQQLARAGHAVTVFERAERAGGLLRYGIPDFKLEKWRIDRRVAQMEAEGVAFRTGVSVGTDVTVDVLRARFDAVCLATGAQRARDLEIPGRELDGVHLALDYLTQANRAIAGGPAPAISAQGRHVVILGGGDTGSDCLGTAHRQGARSVHQLELMPQPPASRTSATPWPAWPLMLRTSASHEEGGVREFSIATQRFIGDANGRVRALAATRMEWGADPNGTPLMQPSDQRFELAADLVILALGFVGTDASDVAKGLGASIDARGTVTTDEAFTTSTPGVFACGDARRGASLIVWAIREGRDAATAIDRWLCTR